MSFIIIDILLLFKVIMEHFWKLLKLLKLFYLNFSYKSYKFLTFHKHNKLKIIMYVYVIF